MKKRYLFLAHFLDSISLLTNSDSSILIEDDGIIRAYNPLSDVQAIVVTYNAHLLVDYLRLNNSPLPDNIIDLAQVHKQITGARQPWSTSTIPYFLIKAIKKDKGVPKEFDFKSSSLSSIADANKSDLLKIILKRIKLVWKSQLRELKQRGEYERFYQTEFNLSPILYKRQYKGIQFDYSNLDKYLDSISNELSELSFRLRFDYGLTDLNDITQIKQVLKKHGVTELAENFNTANLKVYSKMSTLECEIPRLLYEHAKNKRERSILLSINQDDLRRSHPIYDAFGTVTSRILVRRPSIQYIRKKYRNFIVADDGFCLAYFDYSQCEPGILAHNSGDQNLINDYNSGDIYKQLSNALFDSDQFRKISKVLFLSYLYGMSIKNMAVYVSKLLGIDIELSSEKINTFFMRYNQMAKWKDELKHQFYTTGKVSSSIGNYRYLKASADQQNTNTPNWFLSQNIQGTASLILKESILATTDALPKAEFLIPMHDACLYQIPIFEKESYITSISSIFEKTFKNICPSILPKVNVENFSV